MQLQAETGKKLSNCLAAPSEAELLLLENCSHSSSMLSSKNKRKYSKNK